jgi:PKD repeat protein
MASSTVIVRVTSATASVLSASGLASPSAGKAPLAVRFVSTATGGASPYTYSWNFGDGRTSTSQNPSHTYTSSGTFAVNLTVKDANSTVTTMRLSVNVLPVSSNGKKGLDQSRKAQPRLILR